MLSGAPVTSIKYRGNAVKLNESALYINAKLNGTQLGKYAFTSLQDAVLFAKSGTEGQPTVIYLEPDVYWTDDPDAENKENRLIGMLIPQANITLIGLADNAEHTIIAGNRGQMAGAIGNWNVIGVGDGFKAYNITFGNYCNVDLVYEPDPSKNRVKRQSTITQAQTVTRAHKGELDKWIFDNCRFISFLNVFAAGRAPHRAYYVNCFFQCTDDAIGSGDISVFKNVKFKFFSNHPSWGGSAVLQAYLGCQFETVLRDPGANPTIFFAKNNGIFAVVDCEFNGNATKLEWTDILADNARHYVYNNTLNGRKAEISASRPELSVNLQAAALNAFKVGEEYNVYNLLRGSDDWDPAGQRETLSEFKDLPFRMSLHPDKVRLKNGETANVSYNIHPQRVRNGTAIKWSVSDPDLLSISKNSDGTVSLTGRNTGDRNIKGFVKAETELGIQALVYFEVAGTPRPAPVFTRKLKITNPAAGKLSLSYELGLSGSEDNSEIIWYRVTSPNANDSVKVAVSRVNQPLKVYSLSTGDIGYYLIAKVRPRHLTSYAGPVVEVKSRKIKASDVVTSNISSDFKNLVIESNAARPGFWSFDTYRPIDLSLDFKWEPDANSGWTYGNGSAGTAGRLGLSTTGRGARILYAQVAGFDDMSLDLELSPQKASGQGFGSATGQYLDIYIKFDPKTLTGYALRIQRTPLHAEGVQFTLYQLDNGLGKPISQHAYSSAFLPGCKVQLSIIGNRFTAKVNTSSLQQQSQIDKELAHEVNLSADITVNSFGGFGIQHTGSVSAGNQVMLENISIQYPN